MNGDYLNLLQLFIYILLQAPLKSVAMSQDPPYKQIQKMVSAPNGLQLKYWTRDKGYAMIGPGKWGMRQLDNIR